MNLTYTRQNLIKLKIIRLDHQFSQKANNFLNEIEFFSKYPIFKKVNEGNFFLKKINFWGEIFV